MFDSKKEVLVETPEMIQEETKVSSKASAVKELAEKMEKIKQAKIKNGGLVTKK